MHLRNIHAAREEIEEVAEVEEVEEVTEVEEAMEVTDEMIRYPIPYATQQGGLTARDLFGAAVRTTGLLVFLWGMYCVIWLVSMAYVATSDVGPSMVSRMQRSPTPLPMQITITGFYIGAGIALLKGEWIVRFAYDKHRA
jgi:hypothetical protein